MCAAKPKPLSSEAFAAAENVSRETLARLEQYLALLTRWQSRINLVGRSTLEDPWRRHILDSAQLAPLAGSPVLDVGSGAGLPGLIINILRPELEIHLVESDARKCAFLHEAARETGVSPVIHRSRIESLEAFPCHTVTGRALAPVSELLELAHRFVPSQFLLLKGEEVERELTESSKHWKFQVQRIPSRSDPRGVVLRLWEVSHAGPDLRHREPEGRGR
jgi:16S rRNA (guanine527-N7)-methyltransferase